MLRKVLVGLPVFALVVLSGSDPGRVGAQERRHPQLWAALQELREARREIRDARDDFGGHRDKAVVAIDDAMASLKMVLRVRDDDFKRGDRDRDFYRRHKDHPHLRQVLVDLRQAKEDLRDARGEFGELRERVMRDIDRATEQVEILIQNIRR
jgi:hypothetical protein